MKYALRSSVHVDQIEATVWESGDSAILTFTGGALNGELSLHIPPSVAKATADAFNKAFIDAGLHKSQEEIAAELIDAGRGHQVK